MDRHDPVVVLRDMLKEQVCCVGRIAARHRLPDDVVWDIAKGFEVIYSRACEKVGASEGPTDPLDSPRRMEPHPGLMSLLERLNREDVECRVGAATQ